ncbi:hypothetical protein DL770_006072 [Monosporascus sp. CRB-9-2]|nr:hypothetical protein DL770_006072 [Monosporascus sp. CRB-9-2]
MVDPPPASAKIVPGSWTPSTLAFLFILAVSLSYPDELKKMSGVRSEHTKGPAYEAGRVSDGEPHVASERDPAMRKVLRLKVGAAYSIDVQPAIDRQVSKLLDLIDRKYASDPATTTRPRGTSARFMDFGQKMHFYSFDCLGDFVFSEPFGFLQRDEDVRRMTQVNDPSLRMVTDAGLVPWLAGLGSEWPFKYLLPKEGNKGRVWDHVWSSG